MRKISFVSICLASPCYGRQVHTPSAELRGGKSIVGQRPSKSFGRTSATGDVAFLKALSLLLALDSTAAFNPSVLAAAAGSQPSGHRMCKSDDFSTPHKWRRAPEPCMEEEEMSDEEKQKLEDLRAKLIDDFGKWNDAETTPKAESQAKLERPLVQRASKPARGRVLVANPAKFFSSNIFQGDPVKDLSRFNLQGPLDARYAPDQFANMLPVILLVDYEKGNVARGVLLERRTGALMGDLGMSEYGCVAIAPLWLGGQANRNTLTIVHNVDDMASADELGEGLYTGGWDEAAPRLSNSSLAEGRFKFYLGSTNWQAGQLDQEMENGAWFVFKVDPEIFLKDRIPGWQPGRRKPIWRDFMQLVEGDEEVSQVFSMVYPEGWLD